MHAGAYGHVHMYMLLPERVPRQKLPNSHDTRSGHLAEHAPGGCSGLRPH